MDQAPGDGSLDLNDHPHLQSLGTQDGEHLEVRAIKVVLVTFDLYLLTLGFLRTKGHFWSFSPQVSLYHLLS